MRTIPEESFDSAIVKDFRAPGGFAYSTFEGPKVNAVAPVISSVVQPGTIVHPAPIVAPQPLLYRYGPFPEYYGGFAYNTARYY